MTDWPDSTQLSAGEDPLVAVARSLAEQAHRGQVDKAGQPYITHPGRVAARVAGDVEAVCAAWLHDVVEDSATSLADLRAAGMGERVVRAVDLLTRRAPSAYPGGDPDAYYRQIAADPLALTVKRADLADNGDPARLAALDPGLRDRLQAKYAHATAVLDEEAARRGP